MEKYRYISTFPSVLEVETVDALSCFPQHRRVHTVQRTACNSSQGADPPHFAMQHLSFPFITISPLLSFSNANRPVSFLLYFFLHVTFLLPITPVSTADWYPLPLQLSHWNTQRTQRLKLLSPHCPQQGLVKDRTMNSFVRSSGRLMNSKLPRQKF